MLKYEFTDRGIVVTRPASQGSNRGCFSPTIIETKDITGWQAPYDWILYFSTDHATGSGGIWAVLVKGDPTDTANWVDYDTALANGDFDYLPEKPAKNQIFVDKESAGTQTETPCARVIDGVVYLTTHNNSGPGYDGGDIREQTTSLHTSTDGLNFTWRGYILTYDPRFGAGTGHTGYLEWDLNNGKLDYPHNYIGYSIAGDYSALWGTYELIDSSSQTQSAARWELLQVWKKDLGRVVENVSGYANPELVMTLSPSSLVKQDDGSLMALAEIREQGAGGAQLVPRFSIPVLIADDGFTRLSHAGTPVQGGPDAVNQVVLRDTIEYQGRKFKVYRAVGAGDSSTAVGAIGLMEFELVEGSLPLLDPPYPEREDISFIGISALPSNVKRMTGQGSVAFTSNGLELTLAAGEREGFYLPDVSTDMKMLDVTWLNARLTTFDYWKPHVGFAKDYIRGSALLVEDSIFTSLEASNDLDRQLRVVKKVGGVESYKSYPFDRLGYGGSYSNGESVQAPTSYGLRWMPLENRVSLLSKDTERGFTGSAEMVDGEYTPFIEIENTEASDPITVIIEGIGFGKAGNINYEWSIETKPSGSTITAPSTSKKNFDLTPDVAGDYTLGLVVSDDTTTAPKKFKSLSVIGQVSPPTVVIGPNQSVESGQTVYLDATQSTAGSHPIASYEWTQTAGDTVTLVSGNTASPSFIAPSENDAQTLTFSVVAIDTEGTRSTAKTVSITVAAFNFDGSILELIDSVAFELITDGNLMIYPGRANREIIKLRPSSELGLVVDDDGCIDFESPTNTISKLEVIIYNTSEKARIDSDTTAIVFEGPEAHCRFGDFQPKSAREPFDVAVVLYIEGDGRGVVVYSTSEALSTQGASPISAYVQANLGA